ncbi:hypothetical protein EBB05_21585 [Methylobacterium brachiatum]|nr:hypothetical protein EBB05_21585 [Methylobacterium brachiatum]
MTERSEGLEGELQGSRRRLEGSFQAPAARPHLRMRAWMGWMQTICLVEGEAAGWPNAAAGRPPPPPAAAPRRPGHAPAPARPAGRPGSRPEGP